MRRHVAFAATALLVASRLASAQTPDPSRTPARELGAGWTALAEGRTAEAERAADAILRRTPKSHEGVALKLHTRVAASDATGALDAYERWLESRKHEDVFLIEPVAIGILRALAGAKDPAIASRALEALAAAGDDDARGRLQALAGSGDAASMALDTVLAQKGDSAAVQRLEQRIKAAPGRDMSDAIDVLRKVKSPTSAAVLMAALDPARPLPTKMAAARALGDLEATEAIPQLRQALKDPDPPVRVMAAASLSRLGDQSGAEIVRMMENSPVGDLRLLVAEASAPGNPTGPWVETANAILSDPDPLVRLRAAEVLLQHAADPAAAVKTLQEALADTNPAMRQAAAAVLQAMPAGVAGADIPTLRKLLRDTMPLVRLEAASALLRVSGTIP